jgi:kumamolisin
MANISLKGSERVAMPGARALAPADPDERMEVTVLVRRRAHQDFAARVAALSAQNSPGVYLSREEFAQKHGADPADLAAVRDFATAHGLGVVQEHAGRRTVVLSGTVAQFSAAFNVQLQRMEHDSCG